MNNNSTEAKDLSGNIYYFKKHTRRKTRDNFYTLEIKKLMIQVIKLRLKRMKYKEIAKTLNIPYKSVPYLVKRFFEIYG